jgi:hypothetical protein
MDISQATYEVLNNVIQTTYGKSSNISGTGPAPTHFVSMKVLKFDKKIERDKDDVPRANIEFAGYEQTTFLQIKVNTIVFHENPQSIQQILRDEALEIARKTTQRVAKEYKEEVKKIGKLDSTAEIRGKNFKPKPELKFEIMGETLYDVFSYISANSSYSLSRNFSGHGYSAHYLFEIKAKIE